MYLKKVMLSCFIVLQTLISINSQTSGELIVSVTTSDAGGRYAPAHVVAIWIENEQGNFIKTLLAYAGTRETHLNNWQASTLAAQSEFNKVDAISGATTRTHGVENCSWDGTDHTGDLVADGSYTVQMELTDKNSTGNYSSFAFSKGPNADAQTPANKPSFSSVSINWIPAVPPAAPIADFSASPLTIVEAESVTFSDLSTDEPAEWLWTFNGGAPATSTEQNPRVVYNNQGTYSVTLEVSNNLGSDSKTIDNYITVNENTQAPVADFAADQTSILAGKTTNFSDLSAQGPTSWQWEFSGGIPASSTERNPSVTYSTLGKFDVKLTASNKNGSEVETKTSYISVSTKIMVEPGAGNFKTAYASASNGDTLHLMDGMYDFGSSLALNKPVIIVTDFYYSKDESKWENVILAGSDKQWLNMSANPVGGDTLKLMGVRVKSKNGLHTLKFTSAWAEIWYCKFTDGKDQVSFENGGARIAHCYFENSGDEPIDSDKSRGWIIEHNTMVNPGQDGIEIRAYSNLSSDFIHIARYNTFIGGSSSEDGIQIMVQDQGTKHKYIIHSNTFRNFPGNGIGLNAGENTATNLNSSNATDQIIVYNNTFDNCKAGATQGPNLVFVNNIVVNCVYGVVRGERFGGTDNTVTDYNLFYNNGTDYLGAVGPGNNNISGEDPLFVDNSYELADGSPAVGAGISTLLWLGSDAFSYSPLIYGGDAPDLGGLEGDSKKPRLIVDAGAMIIAEGTLTANLNAVVTKDGLPAGSTTITIWTQESGPGEVTFGDASAPITTALVTQQGNYKFKLTATDSALSTAGTVTVNYVADYREGNLDASANNVALEAEHYRFLVGSAKVSALPGASNDSVVTSVAASDYTEYNIFTSDGTYYIWVSVTGDTDASNDIEVSFRDMNSSVPLSGAVGDSWGKSSWKRAEFKGIPAGIYPLRISAVSAGVSWDQLIISMNSNFDPTRDPVSNSPYGGTNRKIPGLIEGEHYDEGGQGISYNDDDKREGDPTFRAGDNVDVITGGSNGYSVGFTITGEWLEYTVDVTTGIYDIVFYYSSGPSPIGNLKVNLDGTELANISGMEPWKGWAEAATVTVKDIAISGGTDKILKLEIVDGRKFNIDAIEFSNPVTGVSISGCPADSLLAGASHQLTANLSPSDATDQSVSWSSSNTSVATVDASGLVSAVSAGSSTITVTTNDDSFTDNCEVYSTISTDIETRLELNNKWIKLYPNPLNNGLLNVSTSENINQLQIFDLHGKMVHREQNLGTNVTLDLSKLNEGLYMFHIISKQSKAVRKVLIQ